MKKKNLILRKFRHGFEKYLPLQSTTRIFFACQVCKKIQKLKYNCSTLYMWTLNVTKGNAIPLTAPLHYKTETLNGSY